MNRSMVVLFVLFIIGLFLCVSEGSYEANWTSLDSRPLPSWYDDSKFGIFIHWSTFSVPAFKNEWYWLWLDGYAGPPPFSKDPSVVAFHCRTYGCNFTYQEFAPLFKAELWDPVHWANVFKASGAKYVVLTSKHHDGYTLWPSAQSWNWNAMDVGPNRDLIKDLSSAVRSVGLEFGVYFSQFEWYNPVYQNDKLHNTTIYPTTISVPQMRDLVESYKPSIIWSDGDWEHDDEYWQSKEFLAWLYNDSPVKESVVTNDRWGSGDSCKHGGFYTCSDRYNPGTLQSHKWENAFTLDFSSWSFNRETTLSGYMTIQNVLRELVTTVACNGNILLNVGPAKDGTLAIIFEERLTQLGQWLDLNGEAIYKTRPWRVQNDTLDIWYTQPKADYNIVYAIMLSWPSSSSPSSSSPLQVTLPSPKVSSSTVVTLLGVVGPPLKYVPLPSHPTGLVITLPDIPPQSAVPLQWAWVLKLEKVA